MKYSKIFKDFNQMVNFFSCFLIDIYIYISDYHNSYRQKPEFGIYLIRLHLNCLIKNCGEIGKETEL